MAGINILDYKLQPYLFDGWSIYSQFIGHPTHHPRSNLYKNLQNAKNDHPGAEVMEVIGGKCRRKKDGYKIAIIWRG